MLNDIEIAQQAEMKNIKEVAAVHFCASCA